MFCIEGETANDVWCQAQVRLADETISKPTEGRGGSTRETLHAVLRIRSPLQRWVVARTPPINPAFAIAEVIWMMNGRDDADFVNRWNSRLADFAGHGLTYEGAYGARLRRRLGLDQIRRVCDALSVDRNSRQAVLQIWDANLDLPGENGIPASADVPCNVCSLLKVRSGRLEWTQIMRSNDLFLGMPYNFVQFTFLQEIIAGTLGVAPGDSCHFCDSLHMYERDIARFGAAPTRTPDPNADRLTESLEDSDQYFGELARAICAFGGADPSDVMHIAFGTQIPQPYRNLLLIVGAEATRRKGDVDRTEQCLEACSNRALTQVFRLWLQSRRSRS